MDRFEFEQQCFLIFLKERGFNSRGTAATEAKIVADEWERMRPKSQEWNRQQYQLLGKDVT